MSFYIAKIVNYISSSYYTPCSTAGECCTVKSKISPFPAVLRRGVEGYNKVVSTLRVEKVKKKLMFLTTYYTTPCNVAGVV